MNPYHRCLVVLWDCTLIACVLIAGCSPTPPEDSVEAAVEQHFASRNYRVLDIRIGKISGLPLSERGYMAPRTYAVEISSITLETMRDEGEPWNYKKGRILVFRDANLRIRAGNDTGNEWVVGSIHGIPVP